MTLAVGEALSPNKPNQFPLLPRYLMFLPQSLVEFGLDVFSPNHQGHMPNHQGHTPCYFSPPELGWVWPGRVLTQPPRSHAQPPRSHALLLFSPRAWLSLAWTCSHPTTKVTCPTTKVTPPVTFLPQSLVEFGLDVCSPNHQGHMPNHQGHTPCYFSPPELGWVWPGRVLTQPPRSHAQPPRSHALLLFSPRAWLSLAWTCAHPTTKVTLPVTTRTSAIIGIAPATWWSSRHAHS